MFDQNTLKTLALCCWRESRGEGEDGMRAVAHVIHNRAINWYAHMADPIHFTVYLKGQFPSMSDPHDPEYRLFPTANDPQFAYCLNIATTVVAEADHDLTLGALYYANLTKIAPNCWFEREIILKPQRHPELIVIKNHHFYG